MSRESFFDIIFYNLDKWSKRWRWSTNASKGDSKRSPLKFFSVNILYRNLFTFKPDLFSS